MSFFRSKAYHIAICVLSALLIALWFLPYMQYDGVGYTIFEMSAYGFGVSLRGTDVATAVTYIIFLINVWVFLFTLIRIFKPQWVRARVQWLPMLTLLNVALFGFLILANSVFEARFVVDIIATYTPFTYVFLGLSAYIALMELVRLIAVRTKKSVAATAIAA